MRDTKPECGPLVDLVKTEGVRVARCPCGTVHLTFHRTGVSLQLPADYFLEVAQALGLAKTILDTPQEPVSSSMETKLTGGFVTITPPSLKKPAN